MNGMIPTGILELDTLCQRIVVYLAVTINDNALCWCATQHTKIRFYRICSKESLWNSQILIMSAF